MNNIRFKFIRGEEAKYISHLDMMKMFDRVLRRSKVPIAYSQGFNPHPQMVFGLPLSVGVTSEAEYADFEMSTHVDTSEFIGMLNSSLPSGFQVTDAKERQTKNNIMASIEAASYYILISRDSDESTADILKKVDGFMQSSSIMVEKKSKNGVKEADIRPMIHDIKVLNFKNEAEDFDDIYKEYSNKYILDYIKAYFQDDVIGPKYERQNLLCLSVMLSAGSAANLKPELLVSAMNSPQQGGIHIKALKIHRTGLFIKKDGKLYNPLDTEVL